MPDLPSIEQMKMPDPESAIQFGSPSPIKQKFTQTEVKYRKTVNPSKAHPSGLFQPNTDPHVPFRNGRGPHNSLERRPGTSTQNQKLISPSSFPSVQLDYAPVDQEPFRPSQWKQDGLSLPSFKKKVTLTKDPSRASVAPVPIKVPQEGDRPQNTVPTSSSQSMYSLSSRSPVGLPTDHYDHFRYAIDAEQSTEYTDPAQATEHFKTFLDGDFGGEVEDDEDGALLDSDVVPGMNCRLLPHQVSGVKFLRIRESGKNKINNSGGLLADDMGLGKTVQTMALIVSCPRPTEIKSIKSTLVVAPLSLIEQWAGEIRAKTKLSVYIHHGPSRFKVARRFMAYDVVMTTYNILVTEHNANVSPRSKDEFDKNEINDDRGVFGVCWWRIVLDEAHTIKNKSAKMSIAACALRGINRWCLTGTPIQNNVEDLHSLLKFLRIEPLQDFAIFKEKISGPISRGKTKLAMKRLGAILSKIMLRRTKAVLNQANSGESAAFKLPPRTVKHICIDFSPAEREFYAGLEARADKTLAQMQSSGEIGYMSVLVLLQRLRQACNHTQLVTKALDASEYKVDVKAMSPTKKQDKVLDDLADLFSGVGVSPQKTDLNDIKLSKCGICLCQLSLAEAGQINCQSCQTAVVKARRISTQSSGDSSKFLDISAKLERLMCVLRGDEPGFESDKSFTKPRKIIIFSQWTSMLDLIEPFLLAEKLGFCKYYGSMTNKAREASLEALRKDPHCTILLCSLKAGALGLNLTAASVVVMMDVWWNPAIEDQAIDRVHRIGQTREVLVYKLTIAETVEDRIVKLQEQKREIAKSALGEGGAMGQKLGLKELLALFAREDEY